MPSQTIAFGPLLFNLGNGTLFRDGKLTTVGQKGAALLGCLLDRPGQVRTKAELVEAAWPGMAVEESNLSVQIASLRKLLGPAPEGGEWIITVPRVGYRFVAEEPATSVPSSPIRSEAPSLAVLPFQNLSGDPEQDYFADGVVEDIITALSRFKSFAIIARNSSFIYKGRNVDVRQVSKDLGVRYVLEGSVRRAGNRLRITAQLVDGVTGAHLWAEKVDGAVEDVFDFQDRITESVATFVEPHVQKAEIDRSRLERPASITTYDLYLRALARLYSETAEANAEAHALLTEALALEPDNALILALDAWVLEHRINVGWTPFGPEDRAKCAELARRALQNAAGDASVMALCAMALIQIARDYDWGMATINSAVEANPNSMIVVVRAGIANLHCGNLEKALSYLQKAVRLIPGGLGAHIPLVEIGHVHMILGNYAEAIDWGARALVLNPSFDPTLWVLIAANAHLGRMKEAHRIARATSKDRSGDHDCKNQGWAACQGPHPVRSYCRRAQARRNSKRTNQ